MIEPTAGWTAFVLAALCGGAIRRWQGEGYRPEDAPGWPFGHRYLAWMRIPYRLPKIVFAALAFGALALFTYPLFPAIVVVVGILIAYTAPFYPSLGGNERWPHEGLWRMLCALPLTGACVWAGGWTAVVLLPAAAFAAGSSWAFCKWIGVRRYTVVAEMMQGGLIAGAAFA